MVFARRLLMLMARRLLGAQQSEWAHAMQAEVAAAGSEREALSFAWGCLWAALHHAFAGARGGLAQVHHVGVLSCAVAVLAGCAFMHSAGAPGHYVWMNLGSMLFAVATFYLLPHRRLQADERLRAQWAFALGALMLIAGLGLAPTETSAWLRIGPVTLNLPWLLLPALLLASDVRPQSAARSWAMGGLLMACSALVLQADPVLLGLVAAVLAVRAWRQRDIAAALLALAASAMAACVTPSWQAPQALVFVDQVIHLGFNRSELVGLGLLLAQVMPPWLALHHRQARQHGLVWGLLVVLSLPGWLPSPLVGFAGSFIWAYVLSLMFLRNDTQVHPGAAHRPAAAPDRQAPPPWRRSGLT
ncbi:hypothetical protein D621_16120 [beta proteobacterium AAP51]|nr:hypothetical protein D621_16120 [beta proteobacterium AAP51]